MFERATLSRSSLTGALVTSLALLACEAAPAPAPALTDEGALRARVSVCLGLDAAAAFTFFWPAHLGGAPNAGACVASANNCADVLACGGYARAGCAADDDRCDGGRATACVPLSGGLMAVAETLCDGDPDGNTVCSIADDTKYGRGAFCHGASCTVERCDGSTVVRCRGGMEVRSDCARDGKRCLFANGQAACSYDDTCAVDRCAGDVIELCADNHVVVRERCSGLVPGSTCTARMGLVECLAEVPSLGCTDKTEFQSWCEGRTAVTCFGGVRVELDCAALTDGDCQSTIPSDMTEVMADARCSGTF